MEVNWNKFLNFKIAEFWNLNLNYTEKLEKIKIKYETLTYKIRKN